MRSKWLRRARSGRDRIGRQRAVPVLVGMLLLTVLAYLTLPDPAQGVAPIVGPVGFALYCMMRPSQRLDVFFISAAPSAASAIASDVFDISRAWIAWPMLLVVLCVLWDIDRESREPTSQAAA